MRILPRAPLELPQRDDLLLLKLIRAGFSQRRKQLRKLIRQDINDWDAVSRRLNIAANARAEELSLLQWIALANSIAPPPRPETSVMMDERFSIVDKNDRILRYASRSEVHGNNFRHRAVHILIFNQAGDVYLQQRSRWKDRHPLKWDSSAAGHVAAGESYDDTARHELKEELGVIVPLQKIAKLPASQKTDQEFVWLYKALLLAMSYPTSLKSRKAHSCLRILSTAGHRHGRKTSLRGFWSVGRRIDGRRVPVAKRKFCLTTTAPHHPAKLRL